MGEPIKEKEFQRTVEIFLTESGFLWFHDSSLTHSSVRRTKPGFPDICAVHPDNGVLIFLELKSEKGKMREAQLLWKEAIEKSCAVYIGPVRPSQFGELTERILSLLSQGL